MPNVEYKVTSSTLNLLQDELMPPVEACVNRGKTLNAQNFEDLWRRVAYQENHLRKKLQTLPNESSEVIRNSLFCLQKIKQVLKMLHPDKKVRNIGNLQGLPSFFDSMLLNVRKFRILK